MKHYGDITKINGWKLPIVDVITGGSPCQDLSVAGKREGLAGERSGLFMEQIRAGLDGERSGLFMEQIRIVREMREYDRSNGRATEYIRPRYMVWENVPGAFSSNKGEDFRCVLEETARIADKTAVIPRPRGGGQQVDASWEMGGALLGVYMMHSFGESPRDVKESRLSQILEAQPHPKYSLSARACQGILRRAEKRGKDLPPMLKEALIRQSVSRNEEANPEAVKEY